jgi:hypothetical protein
MSSLSSLAESLPRDATPLARLPSPVGIEQLPCVTFSAPSRTCAKSPVRLVVGLRVHQSPAANFAVLLEELVWETGVLSARLI